jgi:hypothetical protein
MDMKFYEIVVADAQGAERKLRVPSPTDAQAADAAAPLLNSGDSSLSIRETPDDGLQRTDGPPPKTQAEELAPITPGMAARRDAS